MRLNKRPTKFDVNGVPWVIRYRSKKHIDVAENLALCDPDTHTVTMRRGLPDRVFWITLAHELMHAVDTTSGCRRAVDQLLLSKAADSLAVSELYADSVAWAFLNAWTSLA